MFQFKYMYQQTRTTTIVPTAVATCAALGDGGSPIGVILQSNLKHITKL